MRIFVLGLIALAGLAAMSDSASARERRCNCPNCVANRAYMRQQSNNYEQSPNLFQQMWDAEQRKNAWLRQTFFGR